MKTNSERAKIILDRVYEEKQAPTTQNVPVKKKLGWRMITAICVAAVVFVGAISGLILGLTLKEKFDIDNMFIANFSSYSAIGVGEENATSNKSFAFAADGTGQTNTGKLVGIKNGQVEEIRYAKDKDDEKGKKITAPVIDFHAFKNYSIIQFRLNKNIAFFSQTGRFTIDNYPGFDIRTYLIDNRTGKFYSLNEIAEQGTFNYMAKWPGISSNLPKYDLFESDSSIYFWATDNLNRFNKIYKAGVENEELVVKVVYDYDIDNIRLTNGFFVDRYDNIFMYGEGGYYIKKSNGGIIQTNDLFTRSINGIAYHFTNSSNGDEYFIETADKMIDKDGNIVDTDFNCGDVQIMSEYKIKTSGNVEYYFYTHSANKSGVPGGNGFDKIRKITWLDDERINFKYEEIPLDIEATSTPQCVATDDYIYFRQSGQIVRFEITTGEKTILTEDYIFTDISADNLGNVRFEGLRGEDGSKVYGLINNNGEIDVNFKKPEYEIFYIKPLN